MGLSFYIEQGNQTV